MRDTGDATSVWDPNKVPMPLATATLLAQLQQAAQKKGPGATAPPVTKGSNWTPNNPNSIAGIAAALAATGNQPTTFGTEPITVDKLPGAAAASSFVPDIPTFSYTGPSASSMAAAEFDPQFAALAQAAADLQKRYNTGNTDLGNMYGALSKDIRGHSKDITGQYDATGKAVGKAYNDAIASVNNSYTSSQNEVAGLLARLGIQQAAPTLLNETAAQKQKDIADLATRKADQSAFVSTQGQNEVDYNNKTADTTGLAGKNAQADLLAQFMGLTAQNDAKKLDLTGAKAKAENQYNMSIQDTIAKAQQSAIDNYFKQQNLIGDQEDRSLRAQSAQDDSDYKKAQIALDTQKFQSQIGEDNSKAETDRLKAMLDQGDIYGVLANSANQYYGDASKASGAVQRIVNAYKNAGSQDNLGAFLESVTSGINDPVEAQRLQALAAQWWRNVGNKSAYGYIN